MHSPFFISERPGAFVMDKLDTVVVGAGVVGLAVARALAQSGREVVVLEKERTIGTGVSARNSEVVHAGLYYPTGSLKAQLCVRGKALLYELCASHGVAVKMCGKLVVATDEAQLPGLHALLAKAQANGVPAELLSAQQAQALEPSLACLAALHSPTTGIVDSHGLMLALQGDLERAGGCVAFESAVAGGRVSEDGLVLTVQSPGQGATEVLATTVVNAAALYATAVARSISGLDATHIPTRPLCQRQLLHAGRPRAVQPSGVPSPPRCLAGGAPDAGPGWPSQIWPRPGVVVRIHPGCHRLHRGPRACQGLLRRSSALLAGLARRCVVTWVQRRAAQNLRPW
jgi:voltage-gated potassium channel Kch